MCTIALGFSVAAAARKSNASCKVDARRISVRAVKARAAVASVERFDERALQVACLRNSENLGVIERLAAHFAKSQPPAGIRSRGAKHLEKERHR